VSPPRGLDVTARMLLASLAAFVVMIVVAAMVAGG
jgi:hypothetical protein